MNDVAKESSAVETAAVATDDVISTLYADTSYTFTTGAKYEIKKVNLRVLPDVLNYVKTVMSDLKIVGGMPTIDLLNPADILQLISNNLDASYQMATRLSSITMDELLDAEMDDSLGLIVKIVGVNRSFFVSKVAPLLKSLK